MPDNTTVSVCDMQACLGSLLFLWADIEREMRDQVVRHCGMVPRPSHGIAACLRSWRSSLPHTNDIRQFRGRLADSLIQQLHPALKMRNGLCHGLTGYSSGSERSAHLLWRLNGEDGRVSYEELQTLFSWLARIPQAFSLVASRVWLEFSRLTGRVPLARLQTSAFVRNRCLMHWFETTTSPHIMPFER